MSRSTRLRSLLLRGFAVLSFLSLTLSGFAKFPEPDVIFYGFITIDGQRVTAARTDIVVEARRSLSGTVVANYRMGSDDAAGDAYVLRVPLEAFSPLLNPLASVLGDALRIEVISLAGSLSQSDQTASERGRLRRLDFQIGEGGADTNGLPDPWELSYFGATGQDPDADADGDGLSNRQEYEAGTDPTAAENAFAMSISFDGVSPQVSFLARRATGSGYENMTRYYSLESTTDLGSGQWSEVPGFVDLPGNDQVATWIVPQPAQPTFVRARVRLSAP